MADKRLDEVIKFIKNLDSNDVFNIDPRPFRIPGKGITVYNSYRNNLSGSITLHGKNLDEYYTIKNELFKTLNKKKHLVSQKQIEEVLKETLLLKFNDFDYITYLKKNLLSEASSYSIYFRIEDLTLKGNRKLKCNQCTFFKVTPKNLPNILEHGFDNNREEELHKKIIGQIFCKVDVRALDPVAAKRNALIVLNRNIDILNFSAGLLEDRRRSSGYVYFPYYNLKSNHHKYFVHKNNLLVSTSYGSNHKRAFDLNLLAVEKDINNIFNHICRLVNRIESNPFVESLLTSIQWCGKAMWEHREEISFNNYITSLESLLLQNNDGELSFRLRLYTSFLATKEKKHRAITFDKLRYLYHIRSKITHSGINEISEEDLSLLRKITISVIHSVIYNKKYNFLKSEDNKDFNKKLEEMVLN